MSALHAENFGWFTRAQLTRLYAIEAANGTISLGAFGRSGGSGIRFSADVDDAISIALAAASGATAIAEVDIRLSEYPAAATPILQFTQGGAVQVTIDVATDGKIAAYRGEGGARTLLGTSASVVLTAAQYKRIGAKVLFNGSTGTVTVQAQGAGDASPVTVLTLTSQDTLETGSATWDGFVLGAACDGTTDYCNLVLKDGSGSANNNLATAPQNVYACYPSGDGANSEWTRSAGLLQYAGVDDVTADDDVTYNEADAASETDTLAMQDAPDSGQPVAFVVLALVCKSNGVGETIAHVLRQGSTNTASSAVAPTTSYAALVRAYNATPDATAWSVTQWNAHQAGYRRVA